MADYPAALANLRKALQLFEELEEPVEAADVVLAIGSVHARQGNYAQAIDSFRASLQASHDHANSAGMAVALTALGNIYTDLGDYVAALRHHFDVLRIRETLDDSEALGVTYADIGFVYAQMGELDSALGFFTKSLDLLLDRGNNMLAVRALGNIGAIHLSRGELAEALDYGLRTLVIQEQLGDRRRDPHRTTTERMTSPALISWNARGTSSSAIVFVTMAPRSSRPARACSASVGKSSAGTWSPPCDTSSRSRRSNACLSGTCTVASGCGSPM